MGSFKTGTLTPTLILLEVRGPEIRRPD